MARKRLLIADDDAVFLKLLTYEFEHKDLEIDIVLAENGVQAVELISESVPHAMLLDLRMPIEDGFQVLQHIRDKGHTFPVIVFTHFRNNEYIDRCKDLGACEYIVKSDMRIENVVDKVAAYMA